VRFELHLSLCFFENFEKKKKFLTVTNDFDSDADALRWSVDDVVVWLESKGLGEYGEHFKKSKVNGESLLGLSEAQIRDELHIRGNALHLRSMMAARNALLGVGKEPKDSVLHWSVEDVSIWLEAHEVFTLRETFKKAAIHGAFLMCLTATDLASLVESPLLRTKVTLLIQQLALGITARDKEPVPTCWTVAQVGDWLDQIGLTHYKDIFEKHSIDGLMLSNLDEAMLDHLGLQNQLHRRSIALGLLQLLAAKKGATPRKMSPRDKVCLWQADKVAQWLASNDFDDRKLLFRSNGVHGALLVGLTDADLQNFLDMTNSIERARLLRDIRHLCDEPIDVVPRSPGAPAAGAAEQRKAMAERAAVAAKKAPKRSSDVISKEDEEEEEEEDDDDDDNTSSSDEHSSTSSNNDDSSSSSNNSSSSNSSSSDMPTERLSAGSDKLPHIDLSKKTGVMSTESPPKRYRAELVHVYNAPTLPKPPKDNPPPPSEAIECRLCGGKRHVDCTIGPCGHKVACLRCAELLDKCPSCKRQIDELAPF
jgi:ribosomal protein L12E/L44/L45/RPP1/RPP2